MGTATLCLQRANYPECNSKKANRKYYKKTQSCNITDHHSHWYCTKCKFILNPYGWYVSDPTEAIKCNCIPVEGPDFVLNVLYNDYGVYLSARKENVKVMPELLQSPGGKVETYDGKRESSIEAVWRKTWKRLILILTKVR